MSFSWIVEGEVAAMSRPWPEDIEDLAALGIAGILSLTESVPEGLPHPSVVHLHLPVRDFTAPTLSDFAHAIEFIDGVVSRGSAVAVHCGAGLGRTGTVIAAWLVHHGWEPRAAIREVRRRRPGSIETDEQEAAILRFAETTREGGGMR